MARIIFVISGRVISHQTQKGIVGLQVEVWHKGGRLASQNKLIGGDTTSDEGNFSVAATDDRFDRFSIPPKPDVFFRVLRQGRLLKSTEDDVLKSVSSGRTGIVIEIDLPDEERPFTVGGRVVARRPTQRSVAGLRVEAWHKDAEGMCDKLVGGATTGEQGVFLITATAEHLREFSIPATPDLYFKVYNQNQLIKSTEDSILRAVQSGRADIVIEVGFPIPPDFDEPELAVELGFRLAGTPASGARVDPGQAAPGKVIWVEDGDEVLVHLDSARTRILDGVLIVSVDLETDQTGRQPLVVALALGGGDDPAGLVAVTDELPHGNPALAARWGRSLQAAVWASLLGLASDHAAEQGKAPQGVSAVKGNLRLRAGAELKVTKLV